MGFEKGIRRGSVWDDVVAIDAIIKKTCFALTGKSEREFEFAFTQTLAAHSDKLKGICSGVGTSHRELQPC
jgi:hypothetical protein